MNRLGGVWIDVDRRYFNNNAGLSPTFGYAKINLQPGYQLLTGGSALDYVRFRHTDSDLFRVARQQQFVKAMKYQLAHNFSITKVPKIIGALTKNIEVGAGGGRKVVREDGPQLRVLRLPPAVGPLLPVADPGPDGLQRPPHRPVEHPGAVQDWLQPDVEAARVATAVALGNKVRSSTPTPAQTSVTVLNGNGIEGAAANAGYLLSQRAYRIVPPPDGATGNAPRTNYYSSKVYWNPRVKRSEAAAKSVAKLFAPADAEAMPPEVRPLGRKAMITVVVGSTFHGTITPAPPVKVPTQREPANVTSNAYDTLTTLRKIQPKVPGIKLEYPSVLESSSSPDRQKPYYAYRIHEGDKAVRLVFRTGAGAYWGIEETSWDEAPILSDKSVHHILKGRSYDFYYNGPKLHMIVLHEHGDTYWVVNSLLDNISNETMIAIAKGLRPLEAKK